jgi:hypothetical protein
VCRVTVSERSVSQTDCVRRVRVPCRAPRAARLGSAVAECGAVASDTRHDARASDRPCVQVGGQWHRAAGAVRGPATLRL